MLNDIVNTTIKASQQCLQGEEIPEKKSFGSHVLRFFISLIWFAITLVISLGAFFAMVGQGMSDMLGGEGKALGILAISASLLIAIITFCIPYLRKKGSLTRWCGLVCLGDAAWWIYLMATGF